MKKIFMLPAVDLRGIVPCVTPLYCRFFMAAKRFTFNKTLLNNMPSTKHLFAYTAALILCITSFSSCVKDVSPSDAITTGTLTSTTEGLTNAVNGAYALFKDHVEFNGTADDNNMYLRQYFQLSDFASDDFVCAQVTEDPFFYSFSLNHSPTQTNTRYFWYISYKIINDANTVIAAVEANATDDAARKQLLGECYFLRAFANFNLVKLFARPYALDKSAPGIILRTSTDDPSQKARSTVEEVYNQIVADALKAADLMSQSRGVMFATKEAAWALLSKVYLYMNDNKNAIDYATKVINSGKFELASPAGFKTMFANAEQSSETIFCIAFTSKEDYGKFGSIASMMYSDGNSGWGEEYASPSILALMNKHPEDVRWSYIYPLKDAGGGIQEKNGIPIYYVSKFSFQDGSPTLSSPIMLRFAEMYLNRAEAEAKTGNTAAALNDVDAIRKKRGLQASLYNGQVPSNTTLLNVVLNERRIELAFEAQRTYDVYRNNMPMNRTYWGYHLPGLKETDIDLSKQPTGYANEIIQPDDPRIIYYIPIDEVQSNPLCVQNP